MGPAGRRQGRDSGFGDEGDTVVVLASGDSPAAGQFEGPSTFGEGQPAETTLGAADDWANRKMFLARYTGTGDLVWARDGLRQRQLRLDHRREAPPARGRLVPRVRRVLRVRRVRPG